MPAALTLRRMRLRRVLQVGASGRGEVRAPVQAGEISAARVFVIDRAPEIECSVNLSVRDAPAGFLATAEPSRPRRFYDGSGGNRETGSRV